MRIFLILSSHLELMECFLNKSAKNGHHLPEPTTLQSLEPRGFDQI